MYQIYFFGSVFLFLSGLVLSYNRFGKLMKLDIIFKDEIMSSKKLRILLGVLVSVFSFLMLLSPLKLDTNKPFGDFIPALVGIVGGVFMIFGSVQKTEGYLKKSKVAQSLYGFLNTNIAMLGILMMLLALFHAIFGETPFL